MRPAVIYTQRVDIIASYNERRDSTDQRISKMLAACGALPIPLPNNPSAAREIYEAVKPAGILLTGGNSLTYLGGDAPERDVTDRTMIGMAIETHTPLFGLCRGMQSILDYFKCGLSEVADHVAVRHVLSGVWGDIEVNSYHRQGCTAINAESGLIELARSQDGVIEAVRHRDAEIVGIMWHPERERDFRREQIEMIRHHFGI